MVSLMQCLCEGTFTVFPKHCFCIAYSNANKASEYERFCDLLQRESNTSFSELLPHAQAAQETRSTRLYFQSVLTGGGNPQSHRDRKPAVSNARTQAKGTKNDLKKKGAFQHSCIHSFLYGMRTSRQPLCGREAVVQIPATPEIHSWALWCVLTTADARRYGVCLPLCILPHALQAESLPAGTKAQFPGQLAKQIKTSCKKLKKKKWIYSKQRPPRTRMTALFMGARNSTEQ